MPLLRCAVAIGLLNIVGCGPATGPEAALESFLAASLEGRPGEAFSYLSAADQAAVSLDDYRRSEGEDTLLQGLFTQQIRYEVSDLVEHGDTAIATVTITMPDLSTLLGEFFGLAMASALSDNQDSLQEQLAQSMRERYAEAPPPTVTRTATFTLVRETDGWRVFQNLAADELITEARAALEAEDYDVARTRYDAAIALRPEDLSEVVSERDSVIALIEARESKARYIAEFIELTALRVTRQPRYSFGAPEPSVSGSLRNSGDRTVSVVEVTVYFLGADGSDIAETRYRPVNDYSFTDPSPLRSGYVRDFGYYVRDNAPSSWSGDVRAEVSDIEFAN